jgi:hypothetical protein
MEDNTHDFATSVPGSQITLANHVMRILNRLTPQTYEARRKELLALAILHCSAEEVADVATLIYAEGTRSEDEWFAELCAQLIADFAKHTVALGFGNAVSDAVLSMSQEQFESLLSSTPADDEDAQPTRGTAQWLAGLRLLVYLYFGEVVSAALLASILKALLTVRDAKKLNPSEINEAIAMVIKTLSRHPKFNVLAKYTLGSKIVQRFPYRHNRTLLVEALALINDGIVNINLRRGTAKL